MKTIATLKKRAEVYFKYAERVFVVLIFIALCINA